MADEEQGQPQEPQIIIQPEQMGGVWANYAEVTHSPHEFTLDFVRLDFRPRPPGQPVRGIVVARVALSPRLIREFIDALESNWSKFADKAMPKEIQDGEEGKGQPQS